MGHLNLIKAFKHDYPPKRDHNDEATAVPEEIKRRGTFLEINIGALRKPRKELGPAPELIREAVRLKIPFVLGSDARKKEDIGDYFPETVAMLKGPGVREIAWFEERKPVLIGLPE